MSTLFAVVSFAVVYAFGSELANRVSVYYFDYWDPKFLDQAGNVAVFHQVLPIFISLASLSFLIGLALQRSWLEHAPIWQATLGGALSGGVASLLLLADAVIRRFDGMHGVAGFVVGILLFWAGPACVAAFVFMLLHRYSSVRAV
jgi:hypothetical protein